MNEGIPNVRDKSLSLSLYIYIYTYVSMDSLSITDNLSRHVLIVGVKISADCSQLCGNTREGTVSKGR